MANRLFATKSYEILMKEMAGEHRLRRVLGPVALTSLGVGAIIGTGIFVLTGVAAHDKTGPALMLSFVFSGVACIFAALCYAEFASMVPVAGSAYTYAYATMGELFAWIIGWDLILEYAVASSTVAHGWSHYFQALLDQFNIHLPLVVTNAPFDYDPATGHLAMTGTWFDLPAIVIAAIITCVLVIGIKESAGFNAFMVIVKLAIVFFVIAVGAVPDLDRGADRYHLGAPGHDAQPAAGFPRHGARRTPPDRILRRGARSLPHSMEGDHPDRHLRRHAGGARAAAHPGRPGQHRHPSGLRHGLLRRPDHAPYQPRRPPPVPRSVRARDPDPRHRVVPPPDVLPSVGELGTPVRLARDRFRHLLLLRTPPQRPGQDTRRRDKAARRLPRRRSGRRTPAPRPPALRASPTD